MMKKADLEMPDTLKKEHYKPFEKTTINIPVDKNIVTTESSRMDKVIDL